jgi:prophage regulatory protein
MVQAILRLPQVKLRTGLSRSSIYNAMKRAEFPASVSLGARAIGWRASDIDAWIDSRIATGRKPA